MQQIFYCPNCRAQVAYGQQYCTNCNTVLIWPGSPAQGQYSNQQQYGGQQQGWNQQQWNQQQQSYQSSAVNQEAGQNGNGWNQRQNGVEQQGLLELIKIHKGIITKISIGIVVVIVLIVAGIAFQGEISKLFTVPVITSFKSNTSSILSGEQASIQWNVTGASSVTITPGIGTVSASGTRTVSPATTTSYTLVASSMAGSARDSIIITVTGSLPSIDNFAFDKESIITGQPAILSWSVTDATSVSIEPGIGTVSSSGSKDVTPGADTTYTLTATNIAGNSKATATIKVAASNAPIISTFSINPASIKTGEEATLTWDVIGAKSININQGIGGVASKGSMKVNPTATISYTLTADSNYSTTNKSVTVTVDTSSATNAARTAISTSPPVINEFSLTPASITLGDNTTLTWSVTGSKSISISPSIGTVSSSGSTVIIPTGTTTYTLTAVNSFGTEKATATVTTNTTTDTIAPVISSFTATPSTISSGGTSNLTWNITGATTIVIDQGIGTPASNYSQPVSPAETTTYTLTAINSAGTHTATVTVTVNP